MSKLKYKHYINIKTNLAAESKNSKKTKYTAGRRQRLVNDWEPECALRAIKHRPLLDLTNNSKNYIIQLKKIVKLQAIVRYYYISNLKNGILKLC